MMRFLLSLDYELFFGNPVGTVENCLITPTRYLVEVAEKHDIHCVFFVDACFIMKLKEESQRYPRLIRDLDTICRQLSRLRKNGHDVQLHLHPHWLDSHYDGDSWRPVTTRYKLHDFSPEELLFIVNVHKAFLEAIAENEVFAHRAGGWCLQPFNHLAPVLHKSGLWIDSTVFSGGRSDDEERWFDFSRTPRQDYWFFDQDPLVSSRSGKFLEIPISSIKIHPIFFWKMAVRKKCSGRRYKPFGDGSSLSWGKKYYIKRLTSSSTSVVSIDGLKASLLCDAFRQHRKRGQKLFHVMGHPKALSRYSLERLDLFLSAAHSMLHSVTFRDFQSASASRTA